MTLRIAGDQEGPDYIPKRGQCPLYHLSSATRTDFRLTNELSSTRPNSIDDVFGTIANGNLCVLVLVNISLQVFLNDSQQISDNFGLFLQIATDRATTVFSKKYY
jgi:hypothetical protein